MKPGPTGGFEVGDASSMQVHPGPLHDQCLADAAIVAKSRVIELRHLHYFVAAAEHGSFRKAGSAIGVQQSALSRRIRDLEHHVGVVLFHRYSGGVRLTYGGRRFLQRVRSILKAIGDGVHDIAAIARAEHGHLQIGIYASIAGGFLAELLRRYSDQYPNVHVELIADDPEVHIAAIHQHNIDVAFMAGDRTWPGFATAPLWSEGVFVVVPDDHPLAAQKEVSWQQLAGESFIVNEAAPGQAVRDYLVRRFATFGYYPDIQILRVGRENLFPLVALNRGLTVVSEAMTAALFPGVSYRHITGEILPFSAVWCQRNHNPALIGLLDLADAMAKAIGATARTASWQETNAPPLRRCDRPN